MRNCPDGMQIVNLALPKSMVEWIDKRRVGLGNRSMMIRVMLDASIRAEEARHQTKKDAYEYQLNHD